MVAIRPKVDGGEHPTKCLLTLTLRSILFTIHTYIYIIFKKKYPRNPLCTTWPSHIQMCTTKCILADMQAQSGDVIKQRWRASVARVRHAWSLWWVLLVLGNRRLEVLRQPN